MEPKILICGAGPTGLVLALWLAERNIPFRIIDKAPGPGTTSRAIVLQARTLEFYRQLGIADAVVSKGIYFSKANFWLKGKKIVTVPFGESGTSISPYPYSLIFPQDEQEQLLIECMKKRGIEVERNTELIAFEQQGANIWYQLRKKDGSLEEGATNYLLGCDGAHSAVRKSLGVSFKGGTYEETFYVADIIASGPAVNGEMNGALDEADFLVVFPMKGEGRVRLIGTVTRNNKDKSELTWDDVRESILERLSVDILKVNWFSTYKVHHRVVTRFREGNVFLLGDAAHLHSPTGGQGMNTGIGDAINLAWKLAGVIEGAETSLLDSYESERTQFAHRLVATTDRVFAFVSSRGKLASFIRIHIVPRLFSLLFKFKKVQVRFFTLLSQTEINYRKSPISIGSSGHLASGDRLPWVVYENNGDNFAPLISLQWQMHCYGNASIQLHQLCEEFSLPLHTFLLNEAAKKAGFLSKFAYVIRPDGYIGMITEQKNTTDLQTYLAKFLPKTKIPGVERRI